ncbi:MAG: DUF58 domain-containing protein [Candidatus Hydrogenedentes bacterium]|nr:DUF58 domain-containing protein [Candidatus Hydrogenedentota bacterium]
MRPNYGRAVHGRLTRSGWIMLLVLFLLLLSAWNTGENLLYIVFGCVFGMFFLSMVAGRWSLRKTSVRRGAPYAVFREEPFSCTVHIQNHKRIVPSISLRIQQQQASAGYILRIPARHQASTSIESVFSRRGVYTLPPCELVTHYPFGFLELRRRYEDILEVLVYPKVRPARLPALESSSGMQMVQSRNVGEGDEFFALREYNHGDDLRLIVWRISARLGKWMVREMGIGNARIVTFVLDTRKTDAPDYEAVFEEMIDLAGSLMVTLLKRQYSVGLYTPERSLECAKGTAQEQHILDCLARINPVDASSYPDFDVRVRRLHSEAVRVIGMTPDISLWGTADSLSGVSVLDPGSVVYA